MRELVGEELEFSELLSAEPRRVFLALTGEIGFWWDHRFKEGASVALEPRIGGRFYEETGPDGAVLYATVTRFEPPSRLVLEGPMGMPGAVLSVMDFQLVEEGEGCRLSLRHSILGLLEKPLIEDYRQGWAQILGSTLPSWLAKV